MHDNGEERTDILVLVDDEGNEHDFALVDRFEMEDQEYVILVPALYPEDQEEDGEIDFEDEAYIFRIEEEAGEENLVEVEDETEWQAVASLWEERIGELDIDNHDS